MELQTLTRTRALTPQQATELVGDPVADLPANLNAPTVVIDADSGQPALAYLPLPIEGLGPLRRAVLGAHWDNVGGGVVRGRGLRNVARVFGFGPRRPVYQREGCNSTQLSRDAPAEHAVVAGYASQLAATLAAVAPGVVSQGRQVMTEVAGDWKLGESEMWTSGVINKSSRLPYHRDAMNFPVWSAMPVLRRHMAGGHLSVPEFDLVLPCRDGWGVFFPGYELVHGVTPMQPTRPDGYRYSLVYYALRGMQDCFTYAVEQEYAKKRRTEREQEIARKLGAGETAYALTGVGLPPGRSSAYGRERGRYDAQTKRALAEEYRRRSAPAALTADEVDAAALHEEIE